MEQRLKEHVSVAECLRWYLVISLLLLGSGSAFATDSSSFGGEWVSRTVEGAGSINDNPQCAMISWTDRKIKLEPISGNPTRFRGEWDRGFTGLWMAVNETCRVPGETKFSDSHLAVVDWTLSGIYDPKTGKMRVVGKYTSCVGASCPQLQSVQNDFTTDLMLVGGDLVDVDPSEKPEDHRHFILASSEAQLSEAPIRALGVSLGLVDSENYDRLYDCFDTAFKRNVSKEDMKKGSKTFRANFGPVLSRAPMYTIVAHYSGSSRSQGEYAILINNVYFKQNRGGLEYTIMTKEAGDWKISFDYVRVYPNPTDTR